MPAVLRGTIVVAERLANCNIVCLMRRHRYVVETMTTDVCDFLCAAATVVYFEDLNRLCDVSCRTVLLRRLSAAKAQFGPSGRRVVLLLLLVGSAEPRPDVLFWLNIHCGVELNCCVVLCWSEDECAGYLGGLTESSVVSLDYKMAQKKEDAPIPALIEAFAQTPQLMARNDVVRAAHRFGSVAALLTATAEDLATLPGFGPKKAARLCAVLHAELHASRRLVSDVITGLDGPARGGGDGVGGNVEIDSQKVLAREQMLRVLNQLKDSEMDESKDS